MNFKTPFKVLTTAALIGTLSLSAVAPSASAQTTHSSTVVKKQAAAHEVTELIYKDKATGALIKLAYSEYEALLADSEDALVEAVKGYELAYILTGNGNVYKFADYEAYLAELDGEETAQSTFGNLDNAEKEVTAPENVTEGTLKDGKLVADETPVEEDFKVTEIAAISATKAKVNFSKAAESLDKADVTVTDKDGAKKYIKSVTLSEDKKSATVEFYDALTEGDYKVAVKDAGEATLKLAIGEPAKIEVASQTVKAGTASKLVYKVLDANGLDITADTTVAVESNVSGKFTATKGEVTVNLAADGDTAFAQLSVTKKDDTVVKADRVTVTAEGLKATDFGENWTLVNTGASVDFTSPTYKQDTTLNLGTQKDLKFTAVDQFGDAFSAGVTYKYETLDASKAIVDETTGKVTPRAEGTAAIKVSLVAGGKVVKTQTVELTVKAKAAFTDLKVDSSLDVTTKAPVNLEVSALDQFENEIAGQTITAKSSNEEVATVEASKTGGKVNFAVTGVKAGTATITLKSGEVTKTVTVTVKEPGTLADYKVEGLVSNLLVLDDEKTTDVDETQAVIKVNGIDKDGLVTAADVTKRVTVKDADDQTVTLDTAGTIKASDLLNKKGPFKVTVKVNDLTVAEQTLTLTDNRVAPKYSIKSNDLTVSANDQLNDAIQAALEFERTATQTITVKDVDFASSNEKVIVDSDVSGGDQGKDTTTEDGKTKIYVDSVTVTVAEAGKVTETFTLDFKGEAFNVTTTKDQLAVDNEAAGVITIDAPAANASSLTLPTVIGYTVAIAASSNQQVIGLDGKILPPAADTDVKLKLKLTNNTTNKSATTGEITVAVPAATQVVLGADSLGTTDNEKVTVTSTKKYKVVATTAAGVTTTSYVKADGTLTTEASEVAALTGTEITGLTNGGVSYVISEVE